MNCFYHENLGAVAICVDCVVGLWLRLKNQAALNFFTMIGVWCLANIGSILFAIFRPVDSVNEALERHKDGEGWFIGRLLGGLIVAIFWVFSCLFKSFG